MREGADFDDALSGLRGFRVLALTDDGDELLVGIETIRRAAACPSLRGSEPGTRPDPTPNDGDRTSGLASNALMAGWYLCKWRQPAFVCSKHVGGQLPDFVQGTDRGSHRVEGHRLADRLSIPLKVSFDHELLHGNVALVQGGELGREGPHHARVNSRAVHQTGDFYTSSVRQVRDEVVIGNVAVDTKGGASLLGMNDEGAVLVRAPKLDGLATGNLPGNLLFVGGLVKSRSSDATTRLAVTEPRRVVRSCLEGLNQ